VAGEDAAAAQAAAEAEPEASEATRGQPDPQRPGATATLDEISGAVDLDLDLGLLQLPPEPRLVRKLLGRRWRDSGSSFMVPADVAASKVLTLTDYRRRQGIN
jgi:hypothetical protein